MADVDQDHVPWPEDAEVEAIAQQMWRDQLFALDTARRLARRIVRSVDKVRAHNGS